MSHILKNMRKRDAKITTKHNFIMQRLCDFDKIHPEQHISSLISTLMFKIRRTLNVTMLG